MTELLDILPTDLTGQGLLVFLIFAIAVAALYKLFKLALNTAIAAAAGAAFPWVVEWLSIDIPVAASLESSIFWAALAAALYLGYAFVHYLYWFVRVLAWPFRAALGIEKKRKFSELSKELDDIRKKRKGENE